MSEMLEYVRARFSSEVAGKSLTTKQKSKLLRNIWKDAKRKYK